MEAENLGKGQQMKSGIRKNVTRIKNTTKFKRTECYDERFDIASLAPKMGLYTRACVCVEYQDHRYFSVLHLRA